MCLPDRNDDRTHDDGRQPRRPHPRWGFVVFALGSICWSLVGFSSDQTNLLATNAFLTLVNLVGIWRWLGRHHAYEDGGKVATEAQTGTAYVPI